MLGQIEGTTVLFLAGLVLTCGVLLLRTHRQLGSRPKANLPSPATFSPSPAPPPVGHRLDAPGEIRRFEVEMHDLARVLQAQLDSKITILQHLVRDAEQQADRLEAAIRSAAHLTHSPAEHKGVPSEIDLSSHLRLDVPAGNAGNSASRRHAEIYSLADAGLSSASIASRVGSPIGEVELILGLRGRGGST
jgi:hypothetical protein